MCSNCSGGWEQEYEVETEEDEMAQEKLVDLDSMIMDVEVTRLSDTKVKVKFVAIAGGTGPELTMTYGLASDLLIGLKKALQEKNNGR